MIDTQTVGPHPPRAAASRGALSGAVILTLAVGAVDWLAGNEVSVLALYLLPAALAGFRAGRRWGITVALLGAAVWLVMDRASGHPYSHGGIPYWNAVARFAIFAAFGALAGELRRTRLRAAAGPDEDGLPAAASFYRMVEQEYARVARHGRAFTLAYVDAGGVRGEPGAASEALAAAVLDALRSTLRGTDVIARPRGREFALLLADTGPQAAVVALGRVRGVMARVVEGQGGAGSIVIGGVSCTAPVVEANDVIQRAYQLMYQAQRAPGEVALAHEALGEPASAETASPVR